MECLCSHTEKGILRKVIKQKSNRDVVCEKLQEINAHTCLIRERIFLPITSNTIQTCFPFGPWNTKWLSKFTTNFWEYECVFLTEHFTGTVFLVERIGFNFRMAKSMHTFACPFDVLAAQSSVISSSAACGREARESLSWCFGYCWPRAHTQYRFASQHWIV